MKIGVCIYNNNIGTSHLCDITVGKLYEIIEENTGYVKVINDLGQKESFFKSRFETRENQIDLIELQIKVEIGL